MRILGDCMRHGTISEDCSERIHYLSMVAEYGTMVIPCSSAEATDCATRTKQAVNCPACTRWLERNKDSVSGP